MTKIECPECGCGRVTTKIELERIPYGRQGEYVECKTPVRHCPECEFNWIDREGMKVHMLAVEEYERNRNARHDEQKDV